MISQIRTRRRLRAASMYVSLSRLTALSQYGRVSRLTLPGHLTAAVRWTGKPIQLKFEIFAERMRIVQDGKELACSPVEPSLTAGLGDAKVTWGRGVFGPATPTLKATVATGATGAGQDKAGYTAESREFSVDEPPQA